MNYQSYQAMPEEAQQQPVHEYNPARANVGTVHTVTVRGGEMVEQTTSDTEAARSSEASPFHGTEGIFATARNKNGTPAMSIGDDTLLTMPDGMQASAKSLAAIGAITRNPDGSYSEKPAGDSQGDPEEAPTDDYFPVHPEHMEVINAALEPLDQELLDPFIGMAAGAAVGRLTEAQVLDKFSKMPGIGDSGAQRLEVIRSAYQAHADAAVMQRGGIDGADLEGFWAFCREKHSAQLMEAVHKQMRQHDVSGYKALAQKYMTQTAPSLEAFQRAGIPVRKSSHKPGAFEVFSNRPGGGWMSPQAAARAGLI